MAGKIEKSESKSSDLRENVEKALKQNSRSKTLFLPKEGLVLKFVYEDDYFKALGDGVYSFKGFIEFLNGSKGVKVYDGVLRKTGNGYVLEGDFSLGHGYVFEEVEDATREAIEREVVSEEEVLEKKKVGDEEKPTVVRYGFKTGRYVLYDLDKKIIAKGRNPEKKEGAYKVEASKNFPGVVMLWEGHGFEGEELAKVTTPGEELLFDIDTRIIVTGEYVWKGGSVYTVEPSMNSNGKILGSVKLWKGLGSKPVEIIKLKHPNERLLFDFNKKIIATGLSAMRNKGAYVIQASKDFPGVIRLWDGVSSKTIELAKTEKPGEYLLLDLNEKILATGYYVEKEEYWYLVKASEDRKIPARVIINNKFVLEGSDGRYVVYNRGSYWEIEGYDSGYIYAVIDSKNGDYIHAVIGLEDDVEVYGPVIRIHEGFYIVESGFRMPVTVKVNGKTILENAKGTYKVFKKGDSWQVEKLRDEEG
ncbi:hypothetical protein J7L02_03590 [Candidatus Woesearchaeota archaeon]|nr:hypothetical protein [Candidatus Woesearchaeota archaeon]